MTQFSSKPPFNDDPEPYECNMKAPGDLRHTEKDTWTCVDYSHRPRPEFNRPQHNATNPILVARRNNPGEPIYYRNLERWPTWEEVEHARKVLTRRKAVFG